MNDLELKLPPLLVVLIIAIDMWLLSWIFASGFNIHWQFSTPNALLWLSIAIGVVLPLLGVYEFRQHKTTVNPLQPKKSTSVVRSGIYRLTRNPMYLGFLFLLFAFGLWLGSIPALVMLPIFVWYLTRFQIIPEERILFDNFGKPYADYMEQVRRWL